MPAKFRLTIAFLCAALLSPAMADTVLPAKISKDDAAGMMFQHDDMTATTHPDGHETESVTSMVSSDGKYYSGMYRSEATRIEVTEGYGVNEFMYFLKGSVTLTSSDGSEMTVHAGEAVTIPKEWTGVFATEGYEKIWVIYSPDS